MKKNTHLYGESNLPRVLLQALLDQKVLNAKGMSVPLQSNISLSEALSLYNLVRTLRPSQSAEIGFAQGISTLAILQALADNGQGQHHVIDPYQEKFENVGLAMVEKSGLSSWLKFHRQWPENEFPDLPPLQFVFNDGSHLFDLTMMDFVLTDKRLVVGGMVAFHDTWMPAIRKCIRFILNNRAYRVVHDFDIAVGGRRPLKTVAKNLILKLLHLMPQKRRIFCEDVLVPWYTFELGNMVILEKLKEDERDWQFYQSF